MTYNKITTHQEDAEQNLIPVFLNSNVKYLISILGERYQDLENTLNDIYYSRFIDVATGISLENIGLRYGIKKPITGPAATDDDKFRLIIKAKIAANLSNGTMPDFYNILGLLGAIDILARDVPNAALKLTIRGTFLLTLEEMKSILKGAKAPISLELNSFTDTPFGFDDDPESFGFDEGELGESI